MLTSELLAEAPGILNWALEGLDRLNERGHFVMPASSTGALQQLEDLGSPVAAFLREHCVLEADDSVPVDDLWKSWKMWCDDSNRPPGTKAVLGRNLRAAAPTIHKSRLWALGERQWVYGGVRLRHSVDPDPDDSIGNTSSSHGDWDDWEKSSPGSHGDYATFHLQTDGSGGDRDEEASQDDNAGSREEARNHDAAVADLCREFDATVVEERTE